MKIVLLIINIFLINNYLYSQNINLLKPSEKISFEHINEDNGLSDNRITCILQDTKGYLWVGTRYGLNKFDGYNFKIYTLGHFNENIVTAIYEDKNGTIWVGGYNNQLKAMKQNGHLFKYSAENDTFEKFTVNGKVNSIAETESGKLLIGTNFGLNILDINSCKIDFIDLTTNNQYSGITHLTNILVTRKNENEYIWLGTDFGLFLTDSSFNSIKIPSGLLNGLDNKHINVLTIHSDGEGRLWIGTQSSGLILYNLEAKKGIQFKNNNNDINRLIYNEIQSIISDRQGIIWIGTRKGLNKFESQKNKFIQYFHIESDPSSLSNSNITALYEDKSGVIWIGTKEGGLNKFNKQLNQFTYYSFNTTDPTSVSSDIIRTMFQDHLGFIWICTSNGLDKFDMQNEVFYNFNNQKIYENVWDVNEDENYNIWIAAYNNGLIKFNRKANSFKKYILDEKYLGNSEKSKVNIRTIFIDKKGILWLGTFSNGLYRFDPISEKFMHFKHDPKNPTSISSDRIQNIFETNDGLWIGTFRGGLNKYNPDAEQFKSYLNDQNDPNSLSNDNIWSLYEDKYENLWISTRGGLNRFDKNKENFRRFQFNKDSIANDLTKVIIEDSFNNLWIGNNSGLFKFNRKEEKFTKFDFKNGVPEIEIDAILEDNNNNLWIYGRKYLIKLNPETDKYYIYKIKYDLLLNPLVRRYNNPFLKCANGNLIFAGLRGFVLFDPNSIENNFYKPTIDFTDFKLFNKSVEIMKKESVTDDNKIYLEKHISETKFLEIPYDKGVFSIEFSALDFSDPTKNKFAYKLDGIDPDWVYTDASRRFANYNQLNPGEYLFHVKGSNNNGYWNEDAKSIQIIITPLWWQTIWFRSFLIVAIIGIIISIFYYRINALQKKHRMQEEFSRKLIESQEMERKRIASALHDSHGQNLLVISNEMQYFTKEHAEFKKDLKHVTDIIKESIEEIRNISSALHPHQLDKLGFVKTIKSMINKVSSSTEIIFKLTTDNVNDLFERKIEINIYRIIQEATNNIIKHSGATQAKIDIKKNLESVNVIISDNGRGFNKEEKLKISPGMGLSGIHERAKLINGKMSFESEINKGTIIKISIPIPT